MGGALETSEGQEYKRRMKMTDSRQEERLDYLLRKFKKDSAALFDEHPHARQYGGGCGQGTG